MNEELTALKANDGTLINVWCHRKDGWKWSKDAECYIYADFDQPPTSYCRGERMIHCTYGLDSYGVLWMGSTNNGWHDFQFGSDLTKALQWVTGCQHPELGCQVWGKGE